MKNSFCSILFLIGFTFIGCDNGGVKGIEGNNNDNNEVFIGDNMQVDKSTTIIKGKEEPKDLDILGKWNEKEARQIISQILDKYDDNENSFKCINNECLHDILKFYFVEMESKKMMIGLSASRHVDDVCHPCGKSLSFFEFVKYSKGWKLEEKRLDELSIGSFGEIPMRETSSGEEVPLIDVFTIGYSKYGFAIESGFTNMGFTEGYTVVYSYIAEDLKEVFRYQSYLSDEGAVYYDDNGDELEGSRNSWDSKIRIEKEGTGFYDFVVTTSGIDDGESINTEKRYKFNGYEYTESNVFN